jgi:hypothetical protein
LPFTAAHPAAILPLIRRMDPTCLVIGAMAPDFEYFLRGTQSSVVSHTAPGLLLFCVPVTLSLSWVFHRVVKWPLVLALPERWQGRGAALARGRWPARPWPMLAAAALIGASTHLIWDGLTHTSGYGPELIPALRHAIRPGLPLHRLLQHLSTVVGLALLVPAVWRSWRAATPLVPTPPTSARVWPCFAVLIPLAILVLELRLVWAGFLLDAGNILCAGIAGGLAGTLLASALLRPAGERLRAYAEGA